MNLITRILAAFGLYTKRQLDVEFTEGFFAGVKAASIGISRDSKGRFIKAK